MDKIALITGGTGFLGDKLVSTLLEQNYHVRVVARNEGNLMKLKIKYPICGSGDRKNSTKNLNKE